MSKKEIFLSSFDITWKGKKFKKGDELPYEAKEIPASASLSNLEKSENQNDKEILKIYTKNIKKMSKEEFTIEDLPGVGATTSEKLRDSGYDNLMSIATASPSDLVELTGVGDNVAKRIIHVARTKLDMGFETGMDILKKREQIIKITTGCKAFDDMLKGGFETGAISECFGEWGSSKTQIAHALAVNVQLPKEKGGADGMAVFIDGEATFRPERITQFSEKLGLNPTETLKNIKVARAFNSDHQMLIAEKVEDLIKEGLPIKLIIVDSLTAHFRADFIGRGELSTRQQKLNKHMHVLMKLAAQYNLCVYVTNQVMSKPDTFFGDPTTAIGGNIVGHNSQTRIYLRKGKKGSRVAKLIDSPWIEDSECAFRVTEGGLENV